MRSTATENTEGRSSATGYAAAETIATAEPGANNRQPRLGARIKIFLIDAVIAVLAFLVLQTAAVKTYNTYVKIRWAFSVIDQLDPDQYQFLPQPPDKKIEPADLAKWVKSNLPRGGVKNYAAVGAVFLDTADQLRSGDLEGKSQAYAYTTRELARVVDRATWTPFLTELVKKAETEKGDLADLFETVGTAIRESRRTISGGFSLEPAHADATAEPGAEICQPGLPGKSEIRAMRESGEGEQ